jgi:adenylate kinase family enzyme
MRRVLVVGSTGAGKSTLARVIAARCGIAYHELDALHLTAGWQVRPAFAADVAALVAEPDWVVDSWGDPAVRDLLWTHADTVVWLDLGRGVVASRVLRRSVMRTIRRTPLYGGNRERLADWLRGDHPAWSSVRGHGARRDAIAACCDDPRHAPLQVVRLRTRRAVSAWLAALPHG